MPIGIHLKTASFTNHEVQLQKGDVIYIFSDGYVDQFGGKKGKKFMLKPFKRMLTEIHQRSMEDQKEILNFYHNFDYRANINFFPIDQHLDSN